MREDDQSTSSSMKSDAGSRGTKTRDPLTEALDDAQRMKLFRLLDEWEEPDRYVDGNVSLVS